MSRPTQPSEGADAGRGRAAVVLLSGGLDSTTVLAIAKHAGFSLYALSFDYGQRNRLEIERGRSIAEQYGVVERKCLTIDLRAFGGSSLTTTLPLEQDRPLEEIGKGIPSTFVPARNTLFLSYALAWAEVLGAYDIFIGVNAIDTSGYPDCRPAFIAAFEEAANLGSKLAEVHQTRIHVHAPLQNMTKAEIVRRGTELGVDYSLTSTCYDPIGDAACGRCDACVLRLRGFHEAGLEDPLPYANRRSEG